jgi:4-amino-4-deoxy-L-arabinose transferase-like glycosyltransferase
MHPRMCLLGWVLLIGEESEQARILVALLVSITFLSFLLSVKPLRRPEDSLLMMLVASTLILLYTSALLIKICDSSAAMCQTFGFGETASGVMV